MQSEEYCVDSSKVMEIAFRAILDEIIEHAIEGICFEAHRAMKLGYFPRDEHIIKNNLFALYGGFNEIWSNHEGDIFGHTKALKISTTCPLCEQPKNAQSLGRHLMSCRARISNKSKLVSNGKTENYENNIDGNNSDGSDNFDRKKGNDGKRPAKSTPANYEMMTYEEKQEFLGTYCGVVSIHTGQPCRNTLNCNKHKKDLQDEVRRFIFESVPDHLADDNIDIDTVD